MAEYLAPGVYVEEVGLASKPIEGVSTSSTGFVGITERGPTSPRLVTGYEDFRRQYGAAVAGSYVSDAVYGYFANGGKRAFFARVVGKNAKAAAGDFSAGDDDDAATALRVSAVGAGEWGNRLAVKVDDGSLAVVREGLFKLTVVYWGQAPSDPLVDPTDPSTRNEPGRVEPAVVETYDNVSMDAGSADYVEKRVNGASSLIRVRAEGDAVPASVALTLLSGGNDGQNLRSSDYAGEASAGPGERSGLAALGEVDEVALVVAPDEGSVDGVTAALVSHCELLGDRFAVLQAPQSPGGVTQLRPPVDSKYAAYYYPWLRVLDPATGREKLVPPGGHVAGVFARTDADRGVHKAPANEVLRSVVGLQVAVTKADQEILNPRGVNCIRALPGRGIRVWGARTASSDPAWRYVNIRRLFLYLEESIDEGTQWVVFEPNNQLLWSRVRQSVTDFLTRVWRDGALMGSTREQAFFVKCDETTMTPSDIENGRLVVLVGVAPTRPAEFVVFRISQWRGTAESGEQQ